MSRRHSFPLQGKSCYPWNDDLITTLLGQNVYPLTEENLAIHAQRFPPCKDARRRQARLFVENQRPVIEMEIMLEQQREQEIASFIPIQNNDARSQIEHNQPQQQQQEEKKKNWLNRLTHWIRLDRRGKKRHRSRSAGTEKDDNYGCPPTTEACQKRDSGISLFYNKRRSSSILRSTKNVAVKQPSPPENEELIAFKYPKMVRKSDERMVYITPATVVAI